MKDEDANGGASDQTWRTWRRLVIRSLEDSARAIERLEENMEALARSLPDTLLAEHREMYRWYGLARIIVPIVGGVVLTFAVAYGRKLIGM